MHANTPSKKGLEIPPPPKDNPYDNVTTLVCTSLGLQYIRTYDLSIYNYGFERVYFFVKISCPLQKKNGLGFPLPQSTSTMH